MSSWSDLPRDLLIEIVERIKMLQDYIAFGAVCKRWCKARKKGYFKGLWLRQRIPYLMLPVRDNIDDARDFYSLIEGEIVASVKIPKFKVRKCFESLGWLLAIETDGSMCLLNPFTSVEIPVPHQTTFPEYEPIDVYAFVWKMVLSARPSETSDFILVIICGNLGQLGFWRLGDESWNKIELWQYAYHDVMYYGGHFYAIDGDGNVYVFVLEGDKVLKHREITRLDTNVENFHCTLNDDCIWSDTLYILKTSESLLLISKTASWSSKKENKQYYNTDQFRVYEVDISTGICTYVNDLGSMAIFVGHGTTSAVDTSRLSGIKGNHIYFDGWQCYHFDDEGEGSCIDMGAYSLKTGKIESFYIGEALVVKVCPSIWITPSF